MQAVETNNEPIQAIHALDLLVKATEWMLIPATTPTAQLPTADAPTTPSTPNSAPTTPTTAPLQQRCADIIHNWHLKSTLLDNAISLYNHPQLSYFDHLLHRFNRILEVVCLLDRTFLEQLLIGIHEQLAREDDQLPASLIAHSGGMDTMHRRRLVQHREPYERTNDEMEDAHAYNVSTAYNNFLITLINFILNSPAIASPSLLPPSTGASVPPPTPLTSLALTVIDIAVLTARNAYVQQRQPYAIKQHSNLQIVLLQHLIQRQQQQRTKPTQPPEPQPIAQPTSFTQALDLLRKIFDSPQHGPILRENRSLDMLVSVLLSEGYFLLDTYAPAWETIGLFYGHITKHLTPVAKEKLLRTLGERVARAVYTCKRDKQVQGSWSLDTLVTLIQVCPFTTLLLSFFFSLLPSCLLLPISLYIYSLYLRTFTNISRRHSRRYNWFSLSNQTSKRRSSSNINPSSPASAILSLSPYATTRALPAAILIPPPSLAYRNSFNSPPTSRTNPFLLSPPPPPTTKL